MLELHEVYAGYGATDVVHGVSLTVPDQSVFAIMGHNGAGKTTMLKAILGLVPVRSGSVRFRGADVTSKPTHARVRAGMAYVPQGQVSFGQLTTMENLQVVADAHPGGASRLPQMLEMFPALEQFAHRRAGLLSGGQRQQLSIARALLTDPSLVILDEPTEGIQPTIVAEIEALVMKIAETGVSVLLVEQHIRFAMEAADSFAVMASGHLTATGAGSADAMDSVLSAMSI